MILVSGLTIFISCRAAAIMPSTVPPSFTPMLGYRSDAGMSPTCTTLALRK